MSRGSQRNGFPSWNRSHLRAWLQYMKLAEVERTVNASFLLGLSDMLFDMARFRLFLDCQRVWDHFWPRDKKQAEWWQLDEARTKSSWPDHDKLVRVRHSQANPISQQQPQIEGEFRQNLAERLILSLHPSVSQTVLRSQVMVDPWEKSNVAKWMEAREFQDVPISEGYMHIIYGSNV